MKRLGKFAGRKVALIERAVRWAWGVRGIIGDG